MKITDPASKQPPGMALPMTIIAIAGLALLLVGLLAVLSLEQKTARSYSESARADLAVESGLATALATLTDITQRDDAIVFRIEDPAAPTLPSSDRPLGFREQFFTYGAIYENGAWRGIPLFSGAAQTDLGAKEIQAHLLQPALSAYAADAQQLIHLTEHDQNIPRAKWVDVPGEASDPRDYTTRFAFWIEDLSGRIDGRTAGTTARQDGLDTSELDFATILDPDSKTPILPSTFNATRENFRTAASIRTTFSGAAAPLRKEDGKRLEPYLHFLQPPSVAVPPRLIPQGFGYSEAGQPAHDLNALVSAGDVTGIAEIINRNLPKFSQRKGGFPASQDYLKTLAASMIDYADADSDATTGPDYRGVDSYPFVNEMYDRYQITGQSATATEITVETYIELWNLSQLSITGEVEFTSINKMRFSMPPGVFHQFSDYTFPSRAVTIPANGFRVLYLGKKIYSFPHTIGIPLRLTFNASSQNNFKLKWNGVLVDTSFKGVERTGGFLDAAPLPNGDDKYTYNWKGNASPTQNTSDGQTGDPRASYYVDFRIRNHSYDKSNWGGRSEKRGTTTSNTYEVRLTDWPDRGSSSVSGTQPPNDKVRPISRTSPSTQALDDGTPYPVNQPEMAPAFISNRGRYQSVAEIGNIFDPAQWENIEDKTLYAPQKNAGGGISLAVGRPEFPPFDLDGKRAAQLLDIFYLPPQPSATPVAAPPININTAPREVLRAFLGSVRLDADPANPKTALPDDTQLGDVFADTVSAHRSEFPLRGLSDFSRIGKEIVPGSSRLNFFGNPDAYPDTKRPNATWDDAGREELFRKLIGLITFHSHTFRIVVAGEVKDSTGKVVGRACREYHLTLEAQRDSSGTVNPALPQKINKHYEKSY